MPKLKIGTCSWKYPSWKGLVYSDSKGINFLEEYAGKYPTVEIDQWFWSLFPGTKVKLPNPLDAMEYFKAVPKDFKFSIKVPNSTTLTHYYKKNKSNPPEINPFFLSPSLFDEFLTILEPINDMIGPLIFQFEYLNKQKMQSQKQFLNQIEAFFKQLPESYLYAVEIRNANYLNSAYFECLNGNGLSHVFLQGYWMPDITSVFRKNRKYFRTQDSVIIRLHGPGRQEIEKKTGKKWDKIVNPRDEELYSIASMASELLDQDVNVYIYVNNHYEGSAPLTIKRFSDLLGLHNIQLAL